MSSKDVAVSVRGLSKSYVIAHNQAQHSTVAEALVHKLRNPLQKTAKETFWALKDVSFDIKKGDVVGIVGRNGAGKSTLLKVLSRITEPTQGKVLMNGRVGSLLEVGTGFHAELTGRENIFLNGAILGMKKREIAKQFDSIVDFSGVEKFLDTPVKRYSSGMYVRLAFAVAAHLNPEILIVDEVLAVGDADFQSKCLGKMQDVADSGRTVIFVSHNMATVRQLCKSAIMLKAGQVHRAGTAQEIVSEYIRDRAEKQFTRQTSKDGIELLDISIRDVYTSNSTVSPVFNSDYDLSVTLQSHTPVKDVCMVIRICDDIGAAISHLCSLEEGLSPFALDGTHRFTFPLPKLQLYPGRYSLDVLVTRMTDGQMPLDAQDALAFEVQPSVVQEAAWAYQRIHGTVRICDGVFMESNPSIVEGLVAAGA